MSFFEIFQPGLRHLREERDRLKTLVSRPKHGGEGPLGIDLDGGKATFTMPPSPSTESDVAAAFTAQPAEGSAEEPEPVPTQQEPDEDPGLNDPDQTASPTGQPPT